MNPASTVHATPKPHEASAITLSVGRQATLDRAARHRSPEDRLNGPLNLADGNRPSLGLKHLDHGAPHGPSAQDAIRPGRSMRNGTARRYLDQLLIQPLQPRHNLLVR